MTALADLGNALKAFLRHEDAVMAGHLAFLTILGLFPFLIFLVALAGLIGQTDAGIDAITFLFDNLPPEVGEVLRGPIISLLETTTSGVLTLGLLGAIWVASSALGAARVAIDRAFEAGDPPAFWLRRLHGIGLVIASGLCIVLGMSAFVLGPLAWNAALYFLPVLESWSRLFNLLRYAASTLVIFLALCSLLFALKPRYKGRFVPVARGAFLTIVLWLAVGSGFSLYLKYLAHYDITYGSLAGAIIALMFFYLMSASFLLGVELNAAAARRRAAAPLAQD